MVLSLLDASRGRFLQEYTGIYERRSWIYRGEIVLDGLALVLLLAVVVEKLVEIFKDIVYTIPFLPDKFRPLTLELLSLACGLLLAFQTNINAFELLNVKILNPMVGIVTTGLVIGKGANFAHDFFQSYSVCYKKLKSTKHKFFVKIITPLSMVW